MTKRKAPSRPRCPECGSASVIPIIHGYPSPELQERASRGEVSLGGCLVWDGMPEWECKRCDHMWP
jgi:hypothetical protein